MRRDSDFEKAMAAYLEAHPDFFRRHSELLDSLQIDHQTGAVSLLEYQSNRLRTENQRLRTRLDTFLAAATENEALLERVRSFHAQLLDGHSLGDAIGTAAEALKRDFGCDFVRILLFRDVGIADDLLRVEPESDRYRDLDRPVCGRLHAERLAPLFGDDAESIGSAAIVPLHEGGGLGVLGLASREEDKFHPGVGTLMLSLLGQLLGGILDMRLEHEPADMPATKSA